ncbi:MAG: hypothetical protein MZV70_56280 [Desulfobacterales bacterium]|nr:hypothetical protein [Desulfobacterales bacterium]
MSNQSRPERGFLKMDAADDLGAGDGRVADVGADPGRALHAGRDRQREGENVAAEADRCCCRAPAPG